jgi:hypothetical protein
MARRRLPPPPLEPPARLRTFNPSDWPDPHDWADDEPQIRHVTLGWHAMTDPIAWWADQPHEYRANVRYTTARIKWCQENDQDFVEMLINDRAVRRAAYLGNDGG